MGAPDNVQQAPVPAPEWEGRRQVAEPRKWSLARMAEMWRPKGTTLEPTHCTLGRYALRLIDRETGIPYSADELLAQFPETSSGGLGGADADKVLKFGADGDASITKTLAIFDPNNEGVLIAISSESADMGITAIQGPNSLVIQFPIVSANRQQVLADTSGTIPAVPAYVDLTAANAALAAGDFWWDTTLKKLRTATA